MKQLYSIFIYLLIAICFVSLCLVLFLRTYPLPPPGTIEQLPGGGTIFHNEYPDVLPLLLFYCCVAYFHTMQFFRSAHPKLIQYQIIRLTAFALLVPAVVLLSRAHNYFAEPAEPDYFRVVTLAFCYVMLNVVFKAIFKRYYAA